MFEWVWLYKVVVRGVGDVRVSEHAVLFVVVLCLFAAEACGQVLSSSVRGLVRSAGASSLVIHVSVFGIGRCVIS